MPPHHRSLSSIPTLFIDLKVIFHHTIKESSMEIGDAATSAISIEHSDTVYRFESYLLSHNLKLGFKGYM